MGLRSGDRCESLIIYSWPAGKHQHSLCGKAPKGATAASPCLPGPSCQPTKVRGHLPLNPALTSSLLLGQSTDSVSSLHSLNPRLCMHAIGCPHRTYSKSPLSPGLPDEVGACSQLPGLLAASSTLGGYLLSERPFFSFLASVTSLSPGSVICT